MRTQVTHGERVLNLQATKYLYLHFDLIKAIFSVTQLLQRVKNVTALFWFHVKNHESVEL